MASTTKAISFCEFCVYFSLFFILCPNLTYSTGCQFNQEIKVDYQRSICQIPSNYSLFNDQFHQGIYKCDAQQWLICMEEELGQGIRVSSFSKFVQLYYALNSRICRTWWRWMGGVGVPGSICTLGYQLVKCPPGLTGTMCNPFVEFQTPILSSILILNGSSTVVILVPINGWFV